MSTDNAAIAALEGTSLQAFVSSLAINFVVFCVFVLLFIVLRTRLHRIYEPRAYIEYLSEEKRMPKLPRKPWGWMGAIFRIILKKDIIIEKSGLDAYFFIRFLRMILIIFVPALLLVWPILLPLNIVDGVNSSPSVGQTNVNGLDRLAFGNVSRRHVTRYWAHLIMAYLFVIWICVVTLYEMLHYIEVRQEWLTSPKHRSKASATTILVTTIPKNLLDEDKLRSIYSSLPGGVRNVWLNRDFSNLLVDVNNRDAIARQLELAELNLIKRARAQHLRDLKASPSSKEELSKTESPGEEEKSYRYVTFDQRPKHRLPLFSWFFSLPNWMGIGKKVDTIHWCKAELVRRNVEIEGKQSDPGAYRPMNSAFIQFNRQIAAHMAVQAVPHHTVKAMDPSYPEISPHDVIWSNMQMHWWERYIWVTVVWVVIIAATVFFAVPTAFIGTLAHVTDLVALFPWLSFLSTDKPGAKFWSGLVTGVLPPALLGLLLLLVPILLKLAARLQGHPTRKDVSLAVQNMYFLFLFVQLFLVITISSGVTTLIDRAIHNPGSIPQLLATNLPKAANFFFSYMLLQGLSGASGDLLQWWWITVHYVATSLTSTPRSKWKRWNNMRTNTWGTTYPKFTNLAAIGIIYSIIAPLIMFFVILAFMLFGIAQITSFMYVYDIVTDTGGLSFPKAIQQIFVGVYFLELSLTGLFFLVRHEDGTGVPCKVQAILTIVLLVLTIVFQTLFYKNFHPLVNYLPLDSEVDDHGSNESSPLVSRTVTSDDQGLIYRPAGKERAMNRQSRDDEDLEDVSSATAHMPTELISQTDRDKLLLEAFKHEALRRRTPIIWLPEDDLGIAADEVKHMPPEVQASTVGARLNAKGVAEYVSGYSPPDYVRSDDMLL
ncbi:protein of unknown function [Taphrina deformans PYCC 5710]|uniref:DUF221 domain protein n=1 Tax=Taphrina deformans (strain PYCC 5710 / ATCC 11124 / CBS 356.35 / IMI 108563 / JCM 9778 / NBRC 8474) TaxID=1097556 RepID=R4XFG1_TAPDE|nr:protein of unknown function [Taphrina deformans PYCC 5710]|eukprot:CCG84511.1 protein of unknown function [Taphrina deformans PYCC 5710]